MSTSLGTTIDQAQTAFNNGDYRAVVESCTRIVDQYPHYTAAQRLLGLAYLEQGQAGEAETWFGRLLAHDPRDPSAYLGLGLIAEDRGVLDHALAYCQVAWELAPYDSTFREPISRVAERRYGTDGRLRLTHAALAQIHANAWRLRRAIKEYQAALIALPDRIDLWMGLAETLWILGENADAAEIAREFLKDNSDLIPALVILADLEHRTGDTDEATEYRERLRRLDPDGAFSTAMLARQPAADADYLLPSPDEQPQLAEWAETVVSERPQFAPAPDFTFQPEHDQDVADIEELQPIRLEEFADEMPEIPAEPTTSSFIPESIEEEEEEPDTVEVEQPASEIADEPAEDEIFEEVASEAPEPVAEPEREHVPSLNLLDMELEDPPPFSEDPVDEAELESLLDDFAGIEPMSLDDFGASDEAPAQISSGFFEDSDIDFDIKIEDPDAVQIGGGPPTVVPGVFSTAASVGDPSGLDEDFPELPEVDEPGEDIQVDETEMGTLLLSDADQLKAGPATEPAETSEPEQPEPPAEAPMQPSEPPAATPPPSGTGFTRLLGELGNEGLAPFDPARTASEAAGETPTGDEPAFPSLADGWDEIDAQLASATPGGDPGDDELLDIDEMGLEPFALDDEDMDFVTSVEPAGRAPVTHSETPATDEDTLLPEAADATRADSEPGHVGDLDDVPGLEPFGIEEFDEVGGTDSFDFGVLPWEQHDEGASIDVQELLAEVTDGEEDEDITLDPELPDGADEYLDITQELSSGTLDPQFERRMAEVEQAARENLDRLHRSEGREPADVVAAADVGAGDESEPHDNVAMPTAASMVDNVEMFQRTRQAKAALIDQGVIRGDREFAAPEPTSEPEVHEFEPEPQAVEPEAEAPEPQPIVEDEPVDQSVDVATDLAALRDAIDHDPRDDEARWEYAEALRDLGEIHAAFTEYRWLIRHAPGRHNSIIAALEECAYHDQEADLAHRLLADIYRRRGDSAQARNHASMAMATRRLMREIKM